ncbi:MAG: serine/threonine-protein phosphatase [Treponema sp.]|jgi:sigma-B regulation protein RsbU (phosphoserine phosphatase)|nr:serine/threonine-protein phosphatase [Treponema sp.]
MAQITQDIGRIFSPLQIGFITEVTEPINAGANVDWVLELAADNPELKVIPVERDGTVQGVLPKDVVEKMAKSAWSKFWQKDLDAYVIPIKEVLDATSYINKILEDVLKQESYETTWYVVQHRRSYLGIVSLKKIIEYTNSLRTQDLIRAGEIQQHLLQKSEINDKRFNLCLFNHMAHEIGGDYYRVYQPEKDHIMVGCFDVAGKNISGALTTMALGACFSSFELFQYIGTPEKVTNRINVLIKDVNPPGIFVAAVFFYIDFSIKMIRVHNCGYSPVLIFVPQSDNKISYKISNPSLPPLGIEEEYDFSECQSIPITKGLRLSAYSDGLTDMVNIYGERYGEEQASKLIKKIHSINHTSITKVITKEINSWIGTASLADDVTVMDMRFN